MYENNGHVGRVFPSTAIWYLYMKVAPMEQATWYTINQHHLDQEAFILL